MSDKTKVTFGISNLHVGTYEVASNGTVTLGTPYHQAGAVSLSLEPEGDSADFYADNSKYWDEIVDNGFSGELEVAMFDDDFKTRFLGFNQLADGGISQNKRKKKPRVYIAFQTEGDDKNRRVICYNCSLGNINHEYKTIEDSKEVATDSIDITCVGDNATGDTVKSYKPEDTPYETIFSAPPVPSDTLAGTQTDDNKGGE